VPLEAHSAGAGLEQAGDEEGDVPDADDLAHGVGRPEELLGSGHRLAIVVYEDIMLKMRTQVIVDNAITDERLMQVRYFDQEPEALAWIGEA